MAVTLYTAQVPLRVYSLVATWDAEPGDNLPLESTAFSTANLLANGSITLAPAGAADDTTPAGIVRGQPGLKAPGTVSN